MTIEPGAAAAFIASYKTLLLEVAGPSSREQNVLLVLATARREISEKPSLIDGALARLEARSVQVDAEVITSIRTLQFRDWVYLKDTREYSIFLDTSGETAFGVLGLLDPIRDVVGAVGIVIQTGLVRYRSRFVCDGIVSRLVHLGPNYRKDFNQAYRAAKAEGRFGFDA